MSKRAALYCRVSTKDQHPEVQAEPLLRYAEARTYSVVPDGERPCFTDHGVSGAQASRPALDRMLGLVRRREVDVVVAAKLDRLGRSLRHLLELAAELEALGVDLVIVDQGIDTTTPVGRMTFQVLGAVAEFERSLMRERSIAGVAAARRAGKVPGRPPALGPAARERVARLRSQGVSYQRIAKMLGVAKTTVLRATSKSRANQEPASDRICRDADSGDIGADLA